MKLHSIIFKKYKRKVALVVLTYNQKVLILKRSANGSHPNKWGFPGGGIDHGETPKQAALRECIEEIGIKPKNLAKLGANDRITWFKGEILCDPSKCLDLDYNEHTEWKLVDSQSIYDFETIKGMPELVRIVLHEVV